MDMPPPVSPPPQYGYPDQEAEYLRWLAIAYRVVGGIAGCCVNIFWFHVLFGTGFMFAPDSPRGGPPPAVIGMLFSSMGLLFIAVGYAFAICSWIVARRLEERKQWTFCFVMSIVSIVVGNLPGIALGILGLIVLLRPTVRSRFTA